MWTQEVFFFGTRIALRELLPFKWNFFLEEVFRFFNVLVGIGPLMESRLAAFLAPFTFIAAVRLPPFLVVVAFNDHPRPIRR